MLLLFARTVLLLAQMLRAFVEMLLTDREALFIVAIIDENLVPVVGHER